MAGNDVFTILGAPAGSLILAGGSGSDTYDITFGNLANTVRVADDGAAGTDRLTVRGTPGDDDIFKDATTVARTFPHTETVLSSGIETRQIRGGGGDDLITDPGSDTEIFRDEGNDTIVIDATFGTSVAIDGGAGSDTYIIQDGNLEGPITISDTGETGTDTMSFVPAETSTQTVVEIVLVGADGEQATASLTAGNELSFSPETFTVTAPATNTEPVAIALPGGTELAVTPGDSATIGVQSVSVNILPESLNLDSNGTLTVVVFGAADFDAALIDLGTGRFAGAAAWQSILADKNGDGRLDLQLKFRREDTILDQIYANLLLDDLDADGVLDSNRQLAEVVVTGQTLDVALFSGSDSINLFLSGRSLRNFLDNLFD